VARRANKYNCHQVHVTTYNMNSNRDYRFNGKKANLYDLPEVHVSTYHRLTEKGFSEEVLSENN